MIPSRRQYENWTLPSKYAFWGIIGAVVCLILAVVTIIVGPTKSYQEKMDAKLDQLIHNSSPKTEDLDKSLVSSKITKQANSRLTRGEILARMEDRYDLGYCFFYMDGRSIQYSGYRNPDVTVNWGTMSVRLDTLHAHVALPRMMINRTVIDQELIGLSRGMNDKKSLVSSAAIVTAESIYTLGTIELIGVGISSNNAP